MSEKFKVHRPAPARSGLRDLPTAPTRPHGRDRPEATAARPGPDREADKRDPKAEPDKANLPKEIGGPSGPEPTRYGDWERNGICSDF